MIKVTTISRRSSKFDVDDVAPLGLAFHVAGDPLVSKLSELLEFVHNVPLSAGGLESRESVEIEDLVDLTRNQELICEAVEAFLSHKLPVLSHYQGQLELFHRQSLTQDTGVECDEGFDSVTRAGFKEFQESQQGLVDKARKATIVHLEIFEEVPRYLT